MTTGTTTGAEVMTVAHEETMVPVAGIVVCPVESSTSLSNNSSPVFSCPVVSKLTPLASKTVQVVSSTTPLVSRMVPDKSKCVPKLVLENVLISSKRLFAEFGLIKR
ncbi:MAG: hypothetical protein WCH65_03830 [bacterium]